MQLLKILSVLVLVLAVNISAKNFPSTVEEIVTNLNTAFNQGNPDLLANYIDDKSNFIFNNNVINAVSSYSLNEFLNQVKTKRGDYKSGIVDKAEGQAIIKMEYENDRLSFVNHVVCVEGDTGWRIVNFTMSLNKNN